MMLKREWTNVDLDNKLCGIDFIRIFRIVAIISNSYLLRYNKHVFKKIFWGIVK